jgi:hypothetical protein
MTVEKESAMKRLVLCLLLVVMTSLLSTDVPTIISFQGRLTDQATGNPVDDGVYDLTFTLYDAIPTAL